MSKFAYPNTTLINEKIFRAAQFDAEAEKCVSKEAAAAFRKTAERLRKEAAAAQLRKEVRELRSA